MLSGAVKKFLASSLAILLLLFCGCATDKSSSTQATPEITGVACYEMTYHNWVVETDYAGDLWAYTNVEVSNTREDSLFLGDGVSILKIKREAYCQRRGYIRSFLPLVKRNITMVLPA